MAENEGGAMCPGKRIQVSLTEAPYEWRKSLAEQRDASVSEFTRQAIEQVYVSGLERDLGARGIPRPGAVSLLVADEQEEIGVRGTEVLAGGELDT